MRFIFRFVGLILLAGAFAALIVDGTRSIAAGKADILPLSEVIAKVSPDSLPHLRQLVQGKAPVLWDPLLVTILLLPTWLVLGGLGLFLLVVTRVRAPKIGHSRR